MLKSIQQRYLMPVIDGCAPFHGLNVFPAFTEKVLQSVSEDDIPESLQNRLQEEK